MFLFGRSRGLCADCCASYAYYCAERVVANKDEALGAMQ